MPTIKFAGLAPNTGVKVKSTKTGKTYNIHRDIRSKKWNCTCPHFLFRLRKTGTHCKHITAVLKGEIDNALD